MGTLQLAIGMTARETSLKRLSKRLDRLTSVMNYQVTRQPPADFRKRLLEKRPVGIIL